MKLEASSCTVCKFNRCNIFLIIETSVIAAKY
jgi:hypothetical protein